MIRIKPIFLISLLLSSIALSRGDFTHSGTPLNITKSFDCGVRQNAWKFGRQLLPRRGSFKTLFDALQLGNGCGLPEPLDEDTWIPPYFPTPTNKSSCIFVDAKNGNDGSGTGSQNAPYRSISKAVSQSTLLKPAVDGITILIREGSYYLTETILLRPEHSHLTVQNFEGEKVIVYGGVPLHIPKSAWKLYNVVHNTWVADLSSMDNSVLKLLGGSSVRGLRLKGNRAIRAKFPNGDPELSGNWFSSLDPAMGPGEYTKGWQVKPTAWLKPQRKPDAVEIVANSSDWPNVFWPSSEQGGDNPIWTGMGDWGDFHIGMGGYCDDLSPPTGYWCSMEPPRGQGFDNATMTSTGGTQTHMSPDGLFYGHQLPQADNYSNPVGAVIQTWRGGGRWYTNLCRVNAIDRKTKTLRFAKGVGEGCNQGGEGEVSANEWWIENVLEECDSPGEWFFDASSMQLYYTFNASESPTGAEEWTAVTTEVLFNVSGSKAMPVESLWIRGLQLRDTAYTYLGNSSASLHGMPSGGDWTLQRSGAVTVDGVEGGGVDGCSFLRIDGNGVSLNNYCRNVTLRNNDFEWVGDSAMAAWGSTSFCLNEECDRKMPYPNGPDGRGGEQPRGTVVRGNLAREIGIWQKQSSMWFQAVTAGTIFAENVFFNGPRAALNFNDGFGGGDLVERNLLANCVRESGDHGPINSWDRIPYITEMGMVPSDKSWSGWQPVPPGMGSVVPSFREFRYNFILGVYATQEGLDNDDGSSFYHTHHNFMVYGALGLKSDFGGQWNWHWNNIYAYVSNCFQHGNNLGFFNNTCVTRSPTGYASDCQHEMPKIFGNKVFSQSGSMEVCGGESLAAWVAAGHDPGTTIGPYPTDEELLSWGWAVLNPGLNDCN